MKSSNMKYLGVLCALLISQATFSQERFEEIQIVKPLSEGGTPDVSSAVESVFRLFLAGGSSVAEFAKLFGVDNLNGDFSQDLGQGSSNSYQQVEMLFEKLILRNDSLDPNKDLALMSFLQILDNRNYNSLVLNYPMARTYFEKQMKLYMNLFSGSNPAAKVVGFNLSKAQISVMILTHYRPVLERFKNSQTVFETFVTAANNLNDGKLNDQVVTSLLKMVTNFTDSRLTQNISGSFIWHAISALQFRLDQLINSENADESDFREFWNSTDQVFGFIYGENEERLKVDSDRAYVQLIDYVLTSQRVLVEKYSDFIQTMTRNSEQVEVWKNIGLPSHPISRMALGKALLKVAFPVPALSYINEFEAKVGQGSLTDFSDVSAVGKVSLAGNLFSLGNAQASKDFKGIVFESSIAALDHRSNELYREAKMPEQESVRKVYKSYVLALELLRYKLELSAASYRDELAPSLKIDLKSTSAQMRHLLSWALAKRKSLLDQENAAGSFDLEKPVKLSLLSKEVVEQDHIVNIGENDRDLYVPAGMFFVNQKQVKLFAKDLKFHPLSVIIVSSGSKLSILAQKIEGAWIDASGAAAPRVKQNIVNGKDLRNFPFPRFKDSVVNDKVKGATVRLVEAITEFPVETIDGQAGASIDVTSYYPSKAPNLYMSNGGDALNGRPADLTETCFTKPAVKDDAMEVNILPYEAKMKEATEYYRQSQPSLYQSGSNCWVHRSNGGRDNGGSTTYYTCVVPRKVKLKVSSEPGQQGGKGGNAGQILVRTFLRSSNSPANTYDVALAVGGVAGQAGLSAAELIELIAPQLTAASKKLCAEGGGAGTPGTQGLDGKVELEK